MAETALLGEAEGSRARIARGPHGPALEEVPRAGDVLAGGPGTSKFCLYCSALGTRKGERVRPIPTYESDGYAVAASFPRQAEVHVQQVLEHAGRRRDAQPAADPRKNALSTNRTWRYAERPASITSPGAAGWANMHAGVRN